MPIEPIVPPAPAPNPIEPPARPAPPAAPAPPELPALAAPAEPAVAKTTTPPPEAVLVAGAAWSDTTLRMHDSFGSLLLQMATSLLTKYPGIRVTAFHVLEGTRLEYRPGKGRSPAPVVVSRVHALARKNRRFVRNEGDEAREKYCRSTKEEEPTVRYLTGISDVDPTRDVTRAEYLKAYRAGTLKDESLSVRHVYRHLESLGKKTPGTVKELHVFSHSWESGPVLANTNEFGEKAGGSPSGKYPGKYLDKDCRLEDFDDGRSVIGTLADFKAAFAPRAFSMIWGCHATPWCEQVAKQTVKSPLYRAMVKSPTKEMLVLNVTGDDRGLVTPGPKSLENIVEILLEAMKDSYTKRLAVATGHEVLGALPGTGASFDGERPRTRRLMHIPMGKPYGDAGSYLDTLKLYKDHVKVRFRPEGEYDTRTYGRGYGVYEP